MAIYRYFALAIVLVLALSCSQKAISPRPLLPINVNWPLSDSEVQSVLSKRIFFGHQSVGANIVEGIYDLILTDNRLSLRVVSSNDPASVSGAAFVESVIGSNGDPTSKDTAFAAIVDNGFGTQGGVAMYKYCYVDIVDSSNVQQVFQNYKKNLDSLKAHYPSLTIIPITVPLTTDASKARNDFNNLLRQTQTGIPIFDLAAVESTHSDGSRSYSVLNGETIYTLAPEYTTDGGHLNEVGRQTAAKALLITLSSLN